MHTSITFSLMQGLNCNILAGMQTETYVAVRLQVIEMILATDMSKHFDLLGKLKAKILSSPNRPVDTPEHRLEIFKIAIKAADVGHAAKSRDLHMKWTGFVIEEFFLQGDKEKEKGLAVSMYCDRDKTSIPKSQSGFIKNIVLPIYESLNNYLSSEAIEKNCLLQLNENFKHWESVSSRKRLQTVVPEIIRPEEPMIKTMKRLGSFRKREEEG